MAHYHAVSLHVNTGWQLPSTQKTQNKTTILPDTDGLCDHVIRKWISSQWPVNHESCNSSVLSIVSNTWSGTWQTGMGLVADNTDSISSSSERLSILWLWGRDMSLGRCVKISISLVRKSTNILLRENSQIIYTGGIVIRHMLRNLLGCVKLHSMYAILPRTWYIIHGNIPQSLAVRKPHTRTMT